MRAGGRAGEIYNVVDDDPAPRSQVLAFGRQLLGLPDLERGASSGGSAPASSSEAASASAPSGSRSFPFLLRINS